MLTILNNYTHGRDIIVQIEKQFDDDKLKSIDLLNRLEKIPSGKNSISFENNNLANFVIHESEIKEQRKDVLRKVVKISQTELNKRSLTKNDVGVPSSKQLMFSLTNGIVFGHFLKPK